MRSFSKAIYPGLNRFLEVSPVCIQILERKLNSDILTVDSETFECFKNKLSIHTEISWNSFASLDVEN